MLDVKQATSWRFPVSDRIPLVVVSLVLAASAAISQSFHPPDYLIGAVANPIPGVEPGIQRVDLTAATPRVSTIYLPGSNSRFTMDVDNRQLIVVSEYATATPAPHGCFRVDPMTNAVTTLLQHPGFSHHGSVTIDYNGDYVIDQQTMTTSAVLRVPRAGPTTTLLVPTQAGVTGAWLAKQPDILTGHALVPTVRQVSSGLAWGLLLLDTTTGAFSTFASPTTISSETPYFPQRAPSGTIEKAGHHRAYRWVFGQTPRAITTLSLDPNHYHSGFRGVGAIDLQTAARPRHVVADGFQFPRTPQTVFYAFDAATWTTTQTLLLPGRRYVQSFEFWRGRHTQTVRTGPRRWQLRLSAPHLPGRAYRVAASVTGLAPSTTLPDGRRINLTLDPVTIATAANALPGIWNPGPGVLDRDGLALGQIDLSGVPTIGIPLWIGWAVLDPAAPLGVAYLPDT